MNTAFHPIYEPGTSGQTLLLLHGTGGNERDLLSLGRALDPAAALLGVRGRVLENGMPRFFRRLAEGVFDEDDLIRRTHELADFIDEAAGHWPIDPARLTAVGYSNGANIAAALLLLCPGAVAGAALLRAMVPLIPDVLPDLRHAPVLIASGRLDPIAPPDTTNRLATLLRNAGADVTLHLENAGHGLTTETVETTRLWLHRSDPEP